MKAQAIKLALVLSVIAPLVSSAWAASPPTLERYQADAERVAPPYPTFPGRTRCVCQTADNSGLTYLGYLNSYAVNSGGDVTVNLVCLYPVYTPGVGTSFCSLFEVIK